MCSPSVRGAEGNRFEPSNSPLSSVRRERYLRRGGWGLTFSFSLNCKLAGNSPIIFPLNLNHALFTKSPGRSCSTDSGAESWDLGQVRASSNRGATSYPTACQPCRVSRRAQGEAECLRKRFFSRGEHTHMHSPAARSGT